MYFTTIYHIITKYQNIIFTWMKSVYQYKAGFAGAAIKDVDGKKGIVSGYFSNFDNVDSDGDIIRRGAFTKTILENGPKSTRPRIKHLQNHNPSQPLGVLQYLEEDTKGLAYESLIGTHNLGQDYIKMVESGLITEHSIGFNTLKKNQLQSYDQYKQNPSKGWYEITEVKLWEGSSLTAWGANELTPLTGLKGTADLQSIVDRQKQIENFCKNTTATDETIELLLLHSKQLAQIILDATKPQESTLPVSEIQSIFSTFNNSL